MCGIACILGIRSDPAELSERALAMARLLRHRGPDWSGVYADGDAVLAHERLSISANQMEHARYRFPYNPPATREAYLYRELFESHFPSEAAAASVPGGPSIACSTPAASAWDASFAANADPSGRAVLGVHRNSRGGA